jgi:hypothetical protein
MRAFPLFLSNHKPAASQHRWFESHHLVCLIVTSLAASLFAQDTASAMLRSNGTGVLVNKRVAPAAVALYSDDVIETQATVARIEGTGVTAEIYPVTVLQFENNELVLDHGSLSMNTNRGVKVRAGCVIITPANPGQWTEYNVTDVNGTVNVSGNKSDIYVESSSSNAQQAKQSMPSNRAVVHAGEQISRTEKCAAGAFPAPAAGKSVLNSPWFIAGGAAAIAGVVCWAVCFPSSAPVSPKGP